MFRIAWLPGRRRSASKCAMPRARCSTPPVSRPSTFTATSAGSSGARRARRCPAHGRTAATTDCAFFGAITSKPAGRGAARTRARTCRARDLTYRSPIVRMRQLLDLYICLRPCNAFPAIRSTTATDIDIVVFRENTEGMYIGVEFIRACRSSFYAGKGHGARFRADAAISIRSDHAAEAPGASCARRSNTPSSTGRRKVTAVHKANVLRATCGVFLEAAQGSGRRVSARSNSTPPTSMPCACGC